MRVEVKAGETVFLAPEVSIWDMRQAVKQALRDNQPTVRFTVTHEEHYYAHILNGILFDSHKLFETALELGDMIVGEDDDGAWKCAALWSADSWTGVLLHRQGSKILCAYIPLISRETAEYEHTIAMGLSLLAHEVNDTPVLLEKSISAGEHKLSTLLDLLSEGMDV